MGFKFNQLAKPVWKKFEGNEYDFKKYISLMNQIVPP